MAKPKSKALALPAPRMHKGTPPFAPTDEQREFVRTLIGLGIRQEDVRLLIFKADGKPISKPTLEKYFRKELDTGTIKANAKVAEALYRKATRGDTTAMIFWLKTRGGWREVNRLELTGKEGAPIHIVAGPHDEKI